MQRFEELTEMGLRSRDEESGDDFADMMKRECEGKGKGKGVKSGGGYPDWAGLKNREVT